MVTHFFFPAQQDVKDKLTLLNIHAHDPLIALFVCAVAVLYVL